MACIDAMVGELEADGWVVNQARMWLASQWTVRSAADWNAGEDRFFAHLLDGSRAANRLGWQWTAGLQTGKQYGFSRRQVERRAPALCAVCPLAADCPIEDWPADEPLEALAADPLLRSDPELTATRGPISTYQAGAPDVVWLTAESLGDSDPALVANPDLPAVFVFDEPLLRRLQLSAKRLIFLAEALADLAQRRKLIVYRARPGAVLAERRPAVTFAPVPGWKRISAELELAEVHPWPWLRPPHSGPIQSYSAWRKRVD
jgi:deoxyribodipyrimidine photo-lyase